MRREKRQSDTNTTTVCPTPHTLDDSRPMERSRADNAFQRTQVVCPAAHHWTAHLEGQILCSDGLSHVPGQEGVGPLPPPHRPRKRQPTLTTCARNTSSTSHSRASGGYGSYGSCVEHSMAAQTVRGGWGGLTDLEVYGEVDRGFEFAPGLSLRLRAEGFGFRV